MANNKSAYELLNSVLSQYGISMNAADLRALARDSEDQNVLLLRLQERPEFKARFPANAARKKAGLGELSPAEYVSLEQSYRQQMRAAGLPTGLWDKRDDFAKFIAADVSPAELGERVKIASDAVTKFDSQTKAALKAYYGIDDKGLTAYALDPKKSLPVLQKMADTALLGGEAKRAGLGISGKDAESLVTAGIGREQARQGMGAVAEALPVTDKLATIDKVSVNESQLVKAELGLDAKTKEKTRVMASRERARFATAAQGNPATTIGRTAGSY